MAAGPVAVLPVELEQTCAGVGVMAGTEGPQSTTCSQTVTSLREGVAVVSVVDRNALYCRYRLPLNCASDAPLVVKKVAAVPSGPTKLNGPPALLLAAIWNL